MDLEYSVYLGQEQKNGFTGFLAEKNFFCVVEIFDGYTNEQGESLMSTLATTSTADFESLTGFDASISGILKRLNVPLDTSVAIGFKKNDVLYLKTVGSGEVHISRGKVLETIIKGDKTAAGKCKQNDLFIFTTAFFTESLKGITHTRELLRRKILLQDFPENIKGTIGAEDDTGAVSLFVQITGGYQAQDEQPVGPSVITKLTNTIHTYYEKIVGNINKKTIGIVLVLLFCVGIFGWNVSKGLRARGGVSVGQTLSYDDKKQQIESTIEKAAGETDAVPDAIQLLQTVKGDITALKLMAPKDKQQEVADLQTKADSTESTLLKRVSKTPDEYYDFTVEEKTAQGTKLYVSDDKLFVLNPNGKVYILTLEKKSLDTRSVSKKVSLNSLVAGYDKNAYVLNPEEGILTIDEANKNKLVIPKETQWGNIPSFQVYNGNIYLLDGTNNALYKYSVTTDGYGDRTSYFKGSYADMNTDSTFAIDVSVYVATDNTVIKYTAGLRDDFKFSVPGDNITITKVITHTDQTELYVWDKKNGALYIVTRDGVYERQVTSSLFTQVSDVEVYNNKALLLKGAKLYSIDL